jgi:hypothetical protein
MLNPDSSFETLGNLLFLSEAQFLTYEIGMDNANLSGL